jgi:hypothetical protein
MVIPPRGLVQPTAHGPAQAQLTAAATARRHPTPPSGGRRPWPPPPRPRPHNQPRDGHPGQQPRPRGALLEPGVGTAPPPLRLAPASRAARPRRVCWHGGLGWSGPMGPPYHRPPWPGLSRCRLSVLPRGWGWRAHTAEAPAGADASGPQSAACRAGAPPLHCSAGCSAARRSRTPRPRRSARDTGPHRHRPGPPSRGPDSAPPAG